MTMNAKTVCCRLGLVLILLFSTHAGAQELVANVDRNTISLNDTLTFTLRKSSRSLSDEPDFEPLRRDFDVLSNQRSHQTRIVNGNMETWTEWRLILAPKRHGDFTIPAFEFEGAESDPINVTVQERQQQPDSQGEQIFIETELDKESVRVQEQVLFTVRLYSQVNLDGAEIQPLELEDAVIKAVDENNYITQIDNRQHLVLETTFALFPQKSGTLTLPELTYEVVASRGQRSPWGSRGRPQRLSSESRDIQVSPRSRDAQGDAWLPARDLRLSEDWSSDPLSLRQGEPVTRRITLEVDGLTAAQLPTLTLPDAEGVTFYPDRPQTDERVNASGVQSSSTYTVAMVPNRSGQHTLPELEVQWWDTEAQRLRTATLPAAEIQVEAAPDAAPSPSPAESPRSESSGSSGEGEPAPQAVGWQIWHWILLSLTAVLTAFCLWLGVTRWRLKQELRAIYNLQREDQRHERIVRGKAWQSVKQAAQRKDLPRLRQALLSWGRVNWPQHPPHGLTDIPERLGGSETLRTHLAQLDAVLYRGDSSSSFDASALIQELNRWRESHRKSAANPEAGLRPLYRNPAR